MSKNKDKKQEQEMVEETPTEMVKETTGTVEVEQPEVYELAKVKADLEEMENKYLPFQLAHANIYFPFLLNQLLL